MKSYKYIILIKFIFTSYYLFSQTNNISINQSGSNNKQYNTFNISDNNTLTLKDKVNIINFINKLQRDSNFHAKYFSTLIVSGNNVGLFQIQLVELMKNNGYIYKMEGTHYGTNFMGLNITLNKNDSSIVITIGAL